jgi:hypothetical protein
MKGTLTICVAIAVLMGYLLHPLSAMGNLSPGLTALAWFNREPRLTPILHARYMH